MADCIYNLPKIYQTKKKVVQKDKIYRKDANCSENYYFSSYVFLATFSFGNMVDFVYGRF